MKNSTFLRLNFKNENVFSILFLICSVSLFSIPSFAGKQQNNVVLLSSTIDESIFKLEIEDFSKKKVLTPSGEAFVIEAENGAPILSAGDPDLCKFTASLVIPATANMEVEILSSSFVDYTDVLVAPSKGNFSRTINPSDVQFTYSQTYNEDRFFPGNLSELRSPHIVHNHRGQTVILYPIQYNPVSKTLRVYKNLTVKLKVKNNSHSVNPLGVSRGSIYISPEMDQILERHFINYDDSRKKDKETFTVVEEEGKMLIIAQANFMAAMQPLIDWKKQKGIEVEMVDVATIGNNGTSIKNFVQNYYDTTNLGYLLIAGDAPQVATYNATSGPSDNSYAYTSGMDSYPDFFVGRFSGETVAQIETQVERAIDYEKNPVVGANWYKKGLGYASDQGPGDDNEMDFEHIRNIRAELLLYNYNNIAELYDGSQGGADASGNPSNIDVFNVIQGGIGIINYTGHGSCTSSGTSGFSTSDVASLTNIGKLPFFISVACVNGEFTNTVEVCLAEKFLRQTYNGQPVGAVATLMSTINQSWSPPMEGQDAINDILSEAYVNNIKRTFGGITMNGCMEMNDAYGMAGIEMTDTWTIFGDPSLEVRTDIPDSMTVFHYPTLESGSDQLGVDCDVEAASVAISKDGEILATGKILFGTVSLNFPAILDSNESILTVTVTAYNKAPYIGYVTVQGLNGNASMNQIDGSISISLGPNPALNETELTFNLNKESDVNYVVYDAIGKPMKTETLKGQLPGKHHAKIDLSELSSGVYFLKFTAGSSAMTKKLIVFEN